MRAAGDDERRQVFSAALGQFDELLDAAAAAGPASRPLPLYYALNQATTAIAAALQQPDRAWRPGSHGLNVGAPDPRWLGQTKIRSQPAKRQGEPNATDSFSMPCDVLSVPGLTRPTTITNSLTRPTAIWNVWAAIPGLDRPGLGGGCPRAMPVEFDTGSPHAVSAVLRRQEGLVANHAGQAQLRSVLERNYPAYAEGLVIDGIEDEWGPVPGARAELGWASPDGVRRDIRMQTTEYLGSYWMVPSLNAQGDTLHPLLLWWCLLYTLSDLARYHPAEWGAALDPNVSSNAVPIERALMIALSVVPRLVLVTLVPGARG